MMGQLLSHILSNMSITKVNIIIDKFLHSSKIDSFNEYMDKNISLDMDIQHVSSEGNRGIQAVDFVTGAVHRKYRQNDSNFYDLIEDKVDILLKSPEEIFRKRV